MFSQFLRCSALAAAFLATEGQANTIPVLRRQGDSTSSTNDSLPVKAIRTLSLSNPGFAQVISQGGENALFVSSFSLLGNSVHRINNITSVISTGLNNLKATQVPGTITWPNDITVAPKEVFGTEGVVVGGGFLWDDLWQLIKLISQSGWWYHRMQVADMDGDGKLDMKPTGEWLETEIGAGCDALFTVPDLDADGIPEVIAPSYFTKTLNIFHANASTGFSSAKDVRTISIDSQVGAAFDAQFIDINEDGKKDLLVSNDQGDGTGGVYAYEIPTDITNVSGYTRYSLAAGFPVDHWGLNQAAPGSPKAFFPTPESQAAKKPYVALAGDAAQRAYVLVPSRTPWTYKTILLHDCGYTIGRLGVADVNGDGYIEVIVPCYDDGNLAAYTFSVS